MRRATARRAHGRPAVAPGFVLLDVLLPRIRAILKADTCAVLLLEEQANELVARAAIT